MNFVIQISAPNAHRMKNWGDYHFARGLADALERAGHKARVQARQDWTVALDSDEIDIVLRGRAGYEKRADNLTLYWVISGGGRVPRDELLAADHVFAASQMLFERWAERIGAHKVSLLLQAFDAHRMNLPAENAIRQGVSFVGINRDGIRPIVKIALEARASLRIWGSGWQDTDAAEYVVADRVANENLHKIYSASTVVLNDQTKVMTRSGLISNRIFDALACGAAVITTPVGNLPDELSEFVAEVTNAEEFNAALHKFETETAAQLDKRRTFAKKMREAHSFDNRAAAILRTIEKIRQSEYKIAET